MVLTDYRGLTTSQIEELRQKTEEAGGTFMITKNTLLRLAAEKTGLPRDFAEGEILRGPTATLFSFSDEIAPIKDLVNSAKEWGLPTIKAGFLGQEFITAEKVKELAKLPGKNELLAKLVGQIQAPISTLTNILQGNLRNLIYLLQAINKSKGGEEES